MWEGLVTAAATAVIAITGIAYTVGTFKLLRATRDMFLLNFVLAYIDAQRGGKISTIEEKQASARLAKMLQQLFPKEIKDTKKEPLS